MEERTVFKYAMIARALRGLLAAFSVPLAALVLPLAAFFVPPAAVAQVPSGFFALTINGNGGNGGVAWPNSIAQPLAVNSVRLWDSGTRWNQIETSEGVYDWSSLDALLAKAKANHETVLYTFGGVPLFASSAAWDYTCTEGYGTCRPPIGLNSDGSGTNVQFKAFVTALMEHTGKQIQYFEVWNEVNNLQFWNGSAAQMVRMAHDARMIIKQYNPSAIVLTPSTCACNNYYFTEFSSSTSNPQDAMQYYLGTSANGVVGAPTGAMLADGIAFHAYIGTNPPENINFQIHGMQAAMTAAGVGELPLYISEDSWGPNTIIAGCSPSPPFTQACLDNQAAFVGRSLTLAAANGVQAYYWYAWGDTGHGTLYNTTTGMLYQPGIAYKELRIWLSGASSITPCTHSGTVYTCAFTRSGGFEGLIVWDTAQSCTKNGCTTSIYRVPIAYTTRYDLAGDAPVTLGSTTLIGAKPVLLANRHCSVTAPLCGG